ncbi:MAG: GNAT family N-acetyltransferase [Spirochaetes bacterium]|nr:GNAT family N-acetyltransferase [Spirochaetota bacterium]
MPDRRERNLEQLREMFPDKFEPLEDVFPLIHKGSSIFIGSGCGEPQHLVRAMTEYVNSSTSPLFGTEIVQIWTLGVAPYTDEKFKRNFRHNSFFISDNSRQAVNEGNADYTPIFLSEVPSLFRRGIIPVDVALIQVSMPDAEGNVSLGVNVDIVAAAVESAKLVVAQVNAHMPWVYGDTVIPASRVSCYVRFDEPLIEFDSEVPDEIASRVGKYVSRIVRNGDTIQVGYGSMPNAVLQGLYEKKDLGVHTELLTDGVVDLMNLGVVTNQQKNIDRGKTIASFCMGRRRTYDFMNENRDIELRSIDYVNNQTVIAMQRNICAINSALQIDLTGQASAESIGNTFYSGIGGQVDFMRGAVKAEGGKSILAFRSTSNDGEKSRIVPCLEPGTGATLIRGDVHYVITEYGIAFLHAKNIRERAMSLITIAHPKFRPWLVEEAKRLGYIYRDQKFITGREGEYPEHLEKRRFTKAGLPVLLRPVKISDEDLLKEFFYSLSDKSLYTRFFTSMPYISHRLLQDFVVVDYTTQMVILAILEEEARERVVGIGQYKTDRDTLTADIAFAVRDDYQGNGIGSMLVHYIASIALKEGILGLTADVMAQNKAMIHLISQINSSVVKELRDGCYAMSVDFSRGAPR